MRNTVFCKSGITCVLFGLATASAPLVAQSAKGPPKTLLEYVQKAKAQGRADSTIRRDAVAAGWAPAVVDQALALSKPKLSPLSPIAPTEAQEGPPTAAGAAPASPAPASTGATRPTSTQNGPASPSVVPSRGGPDDYQIGSGDVLQVSVWKSPEISVPSVVVRPDGMITIPLIKDVPVGHLTTRQAERLITEGLAKYIIDPNVTVVVATSNSKKVYIVGAVRAEGPVAYTYRMTVMQAISEAGGLTDYARRKKIYILRNESGRDYRLDFNYDEVVRGLRIEQNIALLPGDTVVIPQ